MTDEFDSKVPCAAAVAVAAADEYPIVLMVELGDAARFERFLDIFVRASTEGVNSEMKKQVNLALVRAVERNDLVIARIILKRNIVIMGMYVKENSALATALRYGHIEMVDFLIQHIITNVDRHEAKNKKKEPGSFF